MMGELFIKKTPLRLQVNPVECGAVALGMVFEYYGHKIDNEKLQELVGVSPNGTDAHAIIRAARARGFEAKAERALPEDLKGSELAILFVDNCHFVVLEGSFRGHFFINDPAQGRYVLSQEQLRKRLSNVMITLRPPPGMTRKRDFSFLKDISTRGAFLFMGLALGWIFIIIALLIGLMAVQGPTLALALSLGTVLLFFTLLAVGVYWRADRLLGIRAHLKRAHLIAALKKVRPSFFYRRPFVRFAITLDQVSDLEKSKWLMQSMLCGIMLALVVSSAIISWLFLWLGLATALLGALFLHWCFDKSSPAAMLTLKESLRQSWVSYPDLEAMGQNIFLENKQIELELRVARSEKEEKHLAQSLIFVPWWLFLFALFSLGGQCLAHGILPPQEIAVAMILSFATFYCATLFARNGQKNLDEAYSASFIEEAEEQARLKSDTPRSPIALAPMISVNNGSFTFAGDEKPTLAHINLRLLPSHFYGLMSPPRSGTSTLLKLLAQKMPWSKGGMSFYASRWALVDDEAELFHGTLWDNLTLFDRRISEREVAASLNKACIEELFLHRPLGLLALIEERGKNLSMGQKKRLLLARALVHKPELILLDDFFDTLDEELALRVLANLRKNGATVIFTSWRAAELSLADEVIMLANYSIEAIGSHTNLTSNVLYRELIDKKEQGI